MTRERAVYTRLRAEPPLPCAAPDWAEPSSSRRGAALGLAFAVTVLAGIAVIVAGVAFGGGWRVAGGVVAALGAAAIVAPGFAKDKQDNDFEGEAQ